MDNWRTFLGGLNLDSDVVRTEQPGEGNLLVPINKLVGPGLEDAIKYRSVVLKTRIVWYGKEATNFCHEEKLMDTHSYHHKFGIHVTQGARYGDRHPILHPAVAAVDASAGGIDDAFLRAMQNVETMVGGGMRTESQVAMRSVVMKYSQYTFNPIRVLVRAAVLLTNMYMGDTGEELVDYRPVGVTAAPAGLTNILHFAGFAEAQQGQWRDVLFIHCDTPGESYMVDTMHALCSTQFPMEKYGDIADVWPSLNNAVVAYTGVPMSRLPPFKISVFTLLTTMARFCTIFDCHDLWAEALGAVQGLSCRPAGTGMLGGTPNVTWALPESDMRVGAIGPLLAGLTAEGRRTTAVCVPERKQFLYSAAVRGVFLTASYFDVLQEQYEANPVVLAARKNELHSYGALTDYHTAVQLMAGPVAAKARAMGWDCINPLLALLRPSSGIGWERAVFRPHMVPWWTTVCGHMHIKASAEVQQWLKPATIIGSPVPNVWQPFHLVGLTTPSQVASAVRWMGAKIKYTRVQLPTRITSYTMHVGAHTRFLPMIKPAFRLGAQHTIIGSVCFGELGLEAGNFLKQLGQARCAMYPWMDSEATYDYSVELADDTFMDVVAHESGVVDTDLTKQELARLDASVVATKAAASYEAVARTAVIPEDEEDVEEGKQIEAQLKEAAVHVRPGSYHSGLATVGSRESWDAAGGAVTASTMYTGNLWDNKDARTGLSNARAFVKYANRVAPHVARDDSANGQLARRVNEVLAKIEQLKYEVREKPRWPEATAPAAEQALSDALGSDAIRSGDVPEAVDDPGAESISVADFGGTGLPPDSGTAIQPAPSVAAVSQAVGSIGFGPPATSEL